MRLRNLMQPIVFVPVLIVVAIVGVWWFAFRSDAATASATSTKQLVAVTSGPMSVTVSAEGTVSAADTDDLSFSSAGTVTAVNVKSGDTVKAGQVLATIDSAALKSAVSAAEANVATAQAKVTDDQSSGASSQQIAADESSLTSSNDSLVDANDALGKASLVATFDGTVATVNITEGEQLSSTGSGATTGTGTDSGTGQSSANIGAANNRGATAASSSSSSSTSSTAQIQVVSTGRYTVQLAVDSADIASVAVGQTATLTRSTSSAATGRFGGFGGGAFPGFTRGGNGTAGSGTGTGTGGTGTGAGGGSTGTGTTAATATGLVSAVGKIADASSGVATYPVTIAFDSTGSDFYIGSTVTGDIATKQRANVVQVSSLAITTNDTGSTVTVATDGTTNGPTETRTVTTGITANGNTEITSGLKAGEKVVVTLNRPAGLPTGFQRGNGAGGGFQRGEFPGATQTGG